MSVKEIKNIVLTSKNKELKEYINKSFAFNQSTHSLMNRLADLKKVDDNTLIYGIARMDQIETDYDHSKHLPSQLVILGLMFGIYITIFPSWIVFLLGSIVSLLILWTMTQERKVRRAAVYFRSLLIQVKESRKEKRSTQ